MKKVFKFFTIIAVLAIIGFSITACGGDGEEPSGVLTITNFPREGLVGDHWVFAAGLGEDESTYLWFLTEVPSDNGFFKGVLLPSSNSITLYAYECFLDYETFTATLTPYTGNTTIPVPGPDDIGMAIDVANSPMYDIFESGAFVPPYTSRKNYRNSTPITFTNGSATINFATQMEFYEP